jgi:hypothetical protein
MDENSPIEVRSRQRGQLPFAVGFLIVAALLAAQIGTQTRWVEGSKLFAQPRFWPAVALALMVGFAAIRVWRLPRRRFKPADWTEARIWLRPLEHVVWFMLYVFTVPIIGFLVATILFATLMTYRMGYTQKRMLVSAVIFAIVVVITFKGLLSVRIPGGMIYEYFPDALRSFFILNL